MVISWQLINQTVVGWVGGGMVVTNRTHWYGNNHWEIFSDLVSWIKPLESLSTWNWRFQAPETGDFMYLKLEISCTWNWRFQAPEIYMKYVWNMKFCIWHRSKAIGFYITYRRFFWNFSSKTLLGNNLSWEMINWFSKAAGYTSNIVNKI